MKLSQKIVLLVVCTLLNTALTCAVEPYKDTSLPIDERVDDLISQMTLAEKIGQLGNRSNAISRLGVASYDYWSEALHGVARAGLATSFPQAIALSSTWNPELIYEVATATSDEARIKNNVDGKSLSYWSPTINMARDPRWGRAEENYGEDPYLTAQIAINFIKGMQGDDPNYLKTIATAKHFAANNVEYNRKGTSSNIDERSLREYYLPAFKATVKEANVVSFMSAYNAVNGVPSPANRTLLTHILRDEWNFSGYVVSDCDAIENVYNPHHYTGSLVEATAISLVNGNDLNCGTTSPDNAQAALDGGFINEEAINIALKRIFKARFLLGEFDPAASVPYTSIPASRLDCQEHRDLALRTAREAIVLLKNSNALLPLNKEAIDTIAIIGPNANAVQLGGYSGSPLVSVSTVQGVADKMGIDISSGIIEAESYTGQNGIRTEASQDGGTNIGYIQNGDYTYYDVVDFGAGKSKIDVRVASDEAGGTLEVLLDGLNGTSLGKLTVPGTGGWQVWTTIQMDIPETSGLQKVYLKFTGGSDYLYNINWFRFYNADDTDPLGGSGRICFAKGCDIEGAMVQAELDKAVAIAKKADVAIVVCGTDLSIADEGEDRTDLNLPGAQDQLIQAVYAANPKTIVVLVNGSSLSINWAQENVPAILTAWYNGQAQGTAIADVLFGDVNPGGKLSTTWVKSTADLPAMNDYDIKNNRTYMYFQGTPLYPFGHGLSYTDFTYSSLALSNETINQGDSIAVSMDITNSGSVPGDEVVQIYTHAQSTLIRPNKELKRFKRISLQPAETKTLTFYLKNEDFQYYDLVSRTFKVENGNVDIYVGSSSEDIRLQAQISTSEATVSSTYRQDPFTVLQAEHLEGKSTSASFKAISQGNMSVNLSGNNSYILIKNVNFSTEAKQINAHLSAVGANSTLDIVVDQLDGQVLGSLAIQAGADLETFTTQSSELSGVTGVRDIYLVLKGTTTSNCRIDWISFQEKASALEDILTPDKQLGYNYRVFPNPTSNNFAIKYHLPQQSDVSISIYSTLGSQIRTFQSNDEAGVHQINLDCNEDRLAAGLYLIKFNANAYRETQIIRVIE